MKYIDETPISGSHLMENNTNIVDLNTRTIYLHGEINENIGIVVTKGLKELDQSKGRILLDINSFGGLLDATLSIISNIRMTESPIVSYISGVAYSAGAFISLAAPNRIASPISSILLHSPLYGFDGSLENHEDLVFGTKEHYERLIKILLKDTELTLKEYKKNTDHKDWILSPKQALKYKIIQKIG